MKKLFSVAAVGLVCLVLALFMNLWDVQTKQSASFSKEDFLSFGEGDALADAIQSLGEPIRVSDSTACEGCRIYLFQGDYPGWVMGGTESWYVANPDGVIVSRIRIVEP